MQAQPGENLLLSCSLHVDPGLEGTAFPQLLHSTQLTPQARNWVRFALTTVVPIANN